MKPSTVCALTAACLVAAPSGFAADDETRAPAQTPQGMILVPGTEAQPIGIGEKRLLKHLKAMDSQQMRKDTFPTVWDQVLLLSTPQQSVAVPDVWLGKYEVTNAQWLIFHDAPENRVEGVKTEGEGFNSLGDLVVELYDVDPGKQMAVFQRAWQYLLAKNPHLVEHLNKDGAENWDPLVAQAVAIQMPAGLEIAATRYLPPTYWVDGVPPEHELSKPVRMVSWQAAADFCEWSGFHLPHETEWERAARGDQGRLYPWGDEWGPTRALWAGFNLAITDEKKAIAKAQKAAAKDGKEPPPDYAGPQPVGNPNNAPGGPVEVDSAEFEAGATPEGFMHMAGNVGEWTSHRAYIYPGSKTGFKYPGMARVARGANYSDDAEFLLATDRIWEGAVGALTDTIQLEGFGFRLAGYPLAGRDLTLAVEARYTAANATAGPPLWLPTPPGLNQKMRHDRKTRNSFKGFRLAGTAGILERQVASARVQHHAYVTGPAKGVALLPIKGFAPGLIKSGNDVGKLADNTDEVFLIGALVGTPGLQLELVKPVEPDPDADPDAPLPEPKRFTVDFGDDSLRYGDNVPGARRDQIGLLLVLRGPEVAVFNPNPGSSGKVDDYLRGEPLGYLPRPWESKMTKGVEAPSAKREGKHTFLTIGVPTLTKKLEVNKVARHVALTIHVSLANW